MDDKTHVSFLFGGNEEECETTSEGVKEGEIQNVNTHPKGDGADDDLDHSILPFVLDRVLVFVAELCMIDYLVQRHKQRTALIRPLGRKKKKEKRNTDQHS